MRRPNVLILLVLAVPALIGASADSGASSFARGDLRRAQALLATALRTDPGDGEAHRLQARVYLALGDGVGAEAELRRAADAGIPPASLHHLLAEALILQGSPDRALAQADAAPSRYAPYATRMRGRALAALDRGDEARAAFEQAVRIAPASLAAWADLARFRADMDDGAGANAALDHALGLDPRKERWERSGALVLKGRLVRRQYGLARALPWFDRALGVDKGNGVALIERAATLGDLGRARDALAATRAAIALGGNDPAAFYLQAVIAARAKDWRLAGVLTGRIGDALDDQPGAMLLTGTVDMMNGNVEQAIARLARLLAIQPDNIKARRLLALAQWRTGDAAGTMATLQPIVEGPDADSYSLSLAGRALERIGDRTGAAAFLDRAAGTARPAAPLEVDIAAAQRAVNIAPDDFDARIALVRALADAGQGADALAAAQTGAASFPRLADAHIAAGDVLGALGRYPEAVEAYARAANIGFTEQIALRMIDALRRAGRVPEASEVLRLLLVQYPRSVAGRLAAAEGMMEAHRWAEAIVLLEGIRRRTGGSDPALLRALAWASANAAQVDRGLAAAQAARRILPASAAANDMLGWLLWRSGRDSARGRSYLMEAGAQAPADPRILAHLAAMQTR